MQPQAELDLGLSSQASFRTIHYLGSKRRLVGQISDLINEVSPGPATCCDLFAGSGVVSFALSGHRPVIAADIQNYSRVLCSALLAECRPSKQDQEDFKGTVNSSPLASQLEECLQPLLKYELQVTQQAHGGDIHPLCEFITRCSIITEQKGSPDALPEPLSSLLASVVSSLHTHGLAESERCVVTRYFGGRYFSFRQAIDLDISLDAIQQLHPNFQDIFTSAVLSTSSDIVNTVGKQFAQPISPLTKDLTAKRHLLSKILADRSVSVNSTLALWIKKYSNLPVSSFRHLAIQGDYRDVLRESLSDAAIIYADPPYTRDHYSRFYHVLETMTLRDTPELSQTPGSTKAGGKGLYRRSRHQSPFCIKSLAPTAFASLFAGARKLHVPLIVSYSPFSQDKGHHPRLLTIDELVRLAREQYKSVEVHSAGHFAHNKMNASRLSLSASDEAETFLICLP